MYLTFLAGTILSGLNRSQRFRLRLLKEMYRRKGHLPPQTDAATAVSGEIIGEILHFCDKYDRLYQIAFLSLAPSLPLPLSLSLYFFPSLSLFARLKNIVCFSQ